ncbi:hypothetical protein ABIQ69_14785 [Agromyces sp. G08B096]|uniref:Uncharacterized protein n=1 Tax=Agromyces sp. G08B096 TaxID=3156399 RepID=A0AAU7W4T9_9MICO
MTDDTTEPITGRTERTGGEHPTPRTEPAGDDHPTRPYEAAPETSGVPFTPSSPENPTVPLTPPAAEASASSSPAPGAMRAEAPAAPPVPPAGPRIRWAGIIWGLVFAAIAGGLLAVLGDPDRRAAATDWWSQLTPGGFALVFVVALGALLLIGGLAALARRAAR